MPHELTIFTQFGDAQPQPAARLTMPSRDQAILYREDTLKRIETAGRDWVRLDGPSLCTTIRLRDIVRIEITEIAADAGT